MQLLKKDILLSVLIQIQGKKKQKIDFINTNKNNEKVLVTLYAVVSTESLKIICLSTFQNAY